MVKPLIIPHHFHVQLGRIKINIWFKLEKGDPPLFEQDRLISLYNHLGDKEERTTVRFCAKATAAALRPWVRWNDTVRQTVRQNMLYSLAPYS